MRWACFALLVLVLLGGFAYQYARHECSWDGAPDDEGERRLTEGARDRWLDPWPWLWRRGTEEAAGPGFQRRQRQRLRRRRRLVVMEGSHQDKSKAAAAAAAAAVVVPSRATSNVTVAKPWRDLQLLEAGALRPFERPTNFTTAGLRRAPPYATLSNCFFTPQCFNVTTPGYGTVQRCKFARICEVCRGTPGRQNCTFVRVTGNPTGLGAQTSLSNVVIPSD